VKNTYTKFTLYLTLGLNFFLKFHVLPYYHSTVGYATTNECYNEQFLSISSGCCNKHRCYNKRGEILSVDVAHVCAWCVRPSHFD